jgi:hypothetical protein
LLKLQRRSCSESPSVFPIPETTSEWNLLIFIQ